MNCCQTKITAPHRQPDSPPVPASGQGLPFLCACRSWACRSCACRKVIRSRSAITSIDIIVSAVLLGAVISTATSLCFRINQIWKGISHQRVATLELANQLDGLTRLNAEEVNSAIQTLQASELCARSLHDPKLSGEVTEDELGVRVTLRISWEAHPQPMQAELAGWLIDPKANRANESSEPPKKAAEPNLSPESEPDQPQASQASQASNGWFLFSPAREGS